MEGVKHILKVIRNKPCSEKQEGQDGPGSLT